MTVNVEEQENRDTLKEIDRLREEAENCRAMHEYWNYNDSNLQVHTDIRVKRIFKGTKDVHSSIKMTKEERDLFRGWLTNRARQLDNEADLLAKKTKKAKLMSTDNGYILRQLPNRKWIHQYVNVSVDFDEEHPYGPEPDGTEKEYSSIERVISVIKEAATQTEHGILSIYYDRPIVNDKERDIEQDMTYTAITDHLGDSNVFVKVMDALHSLDIYGEPAIKIIQTIDKAGIMFVEYSKPESMKENQESRKLGQGDILGDIR